MIGYQDTLLQAVDTIGFYQCYIEGATDFIWGSGKSYYLKIVNCMPTGTRAVMQARVTKRLSGLCIRPLQIYSRGSYQSTLIYQYEPDNLTFLNCTFADTYGQNFVEK